MQENTLTFYRAAHYIEPSNSDEHIHIISYKVGEKGTHRGISINDRNLLPSDLEKLKKFQKVGSGVALFRGVPEEEPRTWEFIDLHPHDS